MKCSLTTIKLSLTPPDFRAKGASYRHCNHYAPSIPAQVDIVNKMRVT